MQQMILASLALALAPSALAQESAPLFELTCPEPGRILTALEGLPSFERLSAAGLLGPRDRPDAALGELEENLGAPLATVLAALADRGLEVEFDLVRFKPSFVLRAEASDPIEAAVSEGCQDRRQGCAEVLLELAQGGVRAIP
ncbi:MAG: hypothetical protein AAFZ65_15390, partial [Planctomycetota bacterium]